MNKRQLNTLEKHRSINNPYTPPNYKSQLSSENYKTLLTGHLPPDVALFDQGSDVTYTCRLDLLTNRRCKIITLHITLQQSFQKKLLEKYNLYLFYKPPYRATFHNSRNEELIYDVPLTNGKLLFKLNINPIYNVPK
ncbi:hypothetical protein E3Q12_04456 [Wallemia mellicola]|nr:hypothetical protein E3Q12_04456 [Wallemia mellicola]